MCETYSVVPWEDHRLRMSNKLPRRIFQSKMEKEKGEWIHFDNMDINTYIILLGNPCIQITPRVEDSKER